MSVKLNGFRIVCFENKNEDFYNNAVTNFQSHSLYLIERSGFKIQCAFPFIKQSEI